MKKLFILSLSLLMVFALFCACKKDSDGPEDHGDKDGDEQQQQEDAKITLSENSLKLEVGDSVALAVVGADGKTVEFVTGDKNVATVSENGVVTAVGEGYTVVYAVVGEDSAGCSVTVKSKPIGAYTISLTRAEYNLEAGETYRLRPTVKNGAKVVRNAECAFSVENDSVCSVSADGTIAGLSRGRTVVHVTYEDCTLDITVRVLRPLSFAISDEDLDLALGGSSTLTATVYDGDSEITDAEFVWTSEDESIATVDAVTGEVTAVSVGQTFVYGEFEDGRAVSTVSVYTKIITTQEDFNSIYANETSLAGNYKIGADIGGSGDNVGTNLSPAFSGVLDGDGHTVNVWAKLFGYLSGTVKNLTVKGSLAVWGPAVADVLTAGGHVENVVVETTITETRCYDNKNNWYARQAGGMFNYNNGGTIENCTVIMTVPSSINITNGFPVASIKAFYSAGSALDSSVTDSVAYFKNDKSDAELMAYGNAAAISLKPTLISGESFRFSESAVSCVSTDPTVIKAKGTGEFEALGVGTAEVTAVFAKYSLTFDVVVLAKEADVLIYSGDTYEFPAGVVSCVSSNPSVIRTDGTTGVTALRSGFATVTVVFADNTTTNYKFSAMVADSDEPRMTLSASSGNIYIGVAGKPATATLSSNVEIIYCSSSDESIATVSDIGVVTAVGNGTATITAYSEGGQSEIIEIAVYKGISTANEFRAIFTDATTRAGNYILAADIDFENSGCFLNSSSIKWDDGSIDGACNFLGVLDGNGHSLDNVGSRLFHFFSGTLKDLTINISASGYPEFVAPAITYFFGRAINVTVNATLNATNTNIGLNAFNPNNSCGGLAVQIGYGAYLENCAVNVTIPSDITIKAGYAIANISAYGAKGNGDAPTFVNCTATLVNNYSDESIYFCKGYSNDQVADTAV